jgi:hypothetical protein
VRLIKIELGICRDFIRRQFAPAPALKDSSEKNKKEAKEQKRGKHDVGKNSKIWILAA